MEIREIKNDKKRYLDLLLLGDEQEDMIDRYLERGTLYVLFKGGEAETVCVVTDEGDGIIEVKNLATSPQSQGQGFGKMMMEHVVNAYRGKGECLVLGTGEVPLTLSFYQKCGFTYSHRIENFFTDNYREPIIEQGVQLVDMVYLAKELK